MLSVSDPVGKSCHKPNRVQQHPAKTVENRLPIIDKQLVIKVLLPFQPRIFLDSRQNKAQRRTQAKKSDQSAPELPTPPPATIPCGVPAALEWSVGEKRPASKTTRLRR